MNDSDSKAFKAVGWLIMFWIAVGAIITFVTHWTIVVAPGEEYSFGGVIILSSLGSLIVGVFAVHPDMLKFWKNK